MQRGNLNGTKCKAILIDEKTGEHIEWNGIMSIDEESLTDDSTLINDISLTNDNTLTDENKSNEDVNVKKPNPIYIPKHVAHRKKRW